MKMDVLSYEMDAHKSRETKALSTRPLPLRKPRQVLLEEVGYTLEVTLR